ncbi:MAG: RNA polymerase sigma factor [Cystobacterineae bacterium]|nr:RNA polymerase sigma factor [Cystobacterineae bacterium]
MLWIVAAVAASPPPPPPLPSTDESDERLLGRYREGEEAAFAQLYQRHRGGLYRFIRGLCSNTAQADEIFQETWLALIRSEAVFEGRSCFKTWLYQIARHRLVDLWRRQESKMQTSDEAEPVPPHAYENGVSETPETLTLRAEQLQQLAEALETLPLAQREVFLLRAHADMALSEIAAFTQMPLEAVKSRYRYALAKLRQYLLARPPIKKSEFVKREVMP